MILFLVDNSASLPPLDPGEKRVSALEKMFAFLEGQTYRLILFGGRREIFVDDVSRYRNDGQWTDFYFAFEKAYELCRSYPEGTAFRLIFVTDGIMDPRPTDWRDMGVPTGADLKTHVGEKLVARVEEMGVPLYVILVGELPKEGVVEGSAELAPPLILEMIAAQVGSTVARLKAEQELRESEERYRTIADFNYDWEYWLGPDGDYIYVSPSCERITGYRADAFLADPGLL